MKPFSVSGYWEKRYRDGRTSGAGSEGETAARKAAFVMDVVQRHRVSSVIDWGVGDGVVLSHIDPDAMDWYVGVDVSPTIIDRVAKKYANRKRAFSLYSEFSRNVTADMGMSLDVLFHFPYDDEYRDYLNRLFGQSTEFVLIYSSNTADGRTSRHVNRRQFTTDVMELHPDWRILEVGEHESADGARFYLYERVV